MLFNKKVFDSTQEFMFLGESVNVARYDKQRYPVFEKLIEKQLSFFWRPEEVDVSGDRYDFNNRLEPHEQHIFTANLKYQTLLDSVQGRAPSLCLLPIVSLPELETWIESWSFSETIHSRSYTHILRNLVSDPSEFFDSIVTDVEIVKRAESVCKYGDELLAATVEYNLNKNNPHTLKRLKKALYLYLVSVNILEGVRFYVSFACSFAFAERKLMEGNAKIIKLISKDEALHLTGTQHMINILQSGRDDPDFYHLTLECKQEVIEMYEDAVDQEKAWATHLFKDGSMIGLNESIIGSYVEFITNQRMVAIGLPTSYEVKSNPLPWMNSWLSSESVQVAPQEAEISSYLVGQTNNTVEANAFDDFEDF